MADVEFVHLRPAPGARDRLLELRPQLIEQYERDFAGLFTTTLTELDDGTWVDVWVWQDRRDAERGLSQLDRYPAFGEWQQHVEELSISWAKQL